MAANAAPPPLWPGSAGSGPAGAESQGAGLFPPQGGPQGVERLFERRTNSAPAAAAASLVEVRAQILPAPSARS